MRVLFIFWASPGDLNSSTLAGDLAQEFSRQGHAVTAVIPMEKKYKRPTKLVKEDRYEALYIKTGNYFHLKSKIEKVITIFTIGSTLLKGVMEYIPDHKFDLIITIAPFLADPKLINPLKKHFNCSAYLLLFDIFPQTAWDLGIIKSKLIFKYFKHKEQQMLAAFNVIWCISPGNVKYMLRNNPQLTATKVEWMYNYGEIAQKPIIDRVEIRKSFGYEESDFVALFGGNMGVPQKLENLLSLAQRAMEIKNAKFLFIGVGTETNRIKSLALKMKLNNIKFINHMSRKEYELLAASCDIGLVSLNERFTVPSFPSKTTDYFKMSLPILASLDRSAADDYGQILQNQIQGGLYVEAGDIDKLYASFKLIYEDSELRQLMGQNVRKFYEQELDVSSACKKIINKFNS